MTRLPILLNHGLYYTDLEDLQGGRARRSACRILAKHNKNASYRNPEDWTNSIPHPVVVSSGTDVPLPGAVQQALTYLLEIGEANRLSQQAWIEPLDSLSAQRRCVRVVARFDSWPANNRSPTPHLKSWKPTSVPTAVIMEILLDSTVSHQGVTIFASRIRPRTDISNLGRKRTKPEEW